MTNAYDEVYRRSLEDPDAFWGKAAAGIDWYKSWDRVLDDSNKPFTRWFTGAECNTCHNALDRHVDDGRGEQAALIYDSPVTGGTVKTYTYRQLRDEVARFAGVLKGLGIGPGDRVLIYMPMVPETAIAMLATARLGAIHSVVFGGFAANELAVRIDDAKPKVIVGATCGIEVGKVIEYMPLLNGAIDIARHKPETCIVLAREQAGADLQPRRDVDWAEAMASAEPADCVPVAATDPLYILYTSGTTGEPKGVVRDNGGHMVALKWSMKNIYDVDPGDVYWAASDVGWVVGHSYIVYGPLLHGCTTILYEGKPVGTPDAGAFWRVISEHKVKVLFTAPTAFRAIKREDPEAKLLDTNGMSAFETLFLAGERTDPDTLPLGRGQPRRARHRPLVADGDRLGHRRQPDRLARFPGQAGLADQGHAGLGRAHPGRRQPGDGGGRNRRHLRQAALAAVLAADPLERRRALPGILSRRVPRPLQDGRRRLQG